MDTPGRFVFQFRFFLPPHPDPQPLNCDTNFQKKAFFFFLKIPVFFTPHFCTHRPQQQQKAKHTNGEYFKKIKMAKRGSQEAFGTDTPNTFATPTKSPQGGTLRVNVKHTKVMQSHMNVDLSLSGNGKHEETLHDLARCPPSSLKGLEKADRLLEAYGIFSVLDLGQWHVYQMAKAMYNLKDATDSKRSTVHPTMNIHRALVEKDETKPLPEVLKLPVSSLVALGSRADSDFAQLGINNIEDLGRWKQARHAEAIASLSVYEFPKTV